MSIGKRIKQRREELGLSVDDVAKQLGKNRATIYRYENDEISGMSATILKPLAVVLKTMPAHLMGWTDNNETNNKNNSISDTINLSKEAIPVKQIPILGSISAGNPLMVADDVIGWIMYPDNDNHDHFALYINGDSMDAAGLNDKDLIIVEVTPTVDNGNIAVVKVNGDDATVKRFYQNDNIVQLVPNSTNPEHQPQVYDLKHTQIDIVGKVIQITRNVR